MRRRSRGKKTRAPDDACRLGARQPRAAANSHRRAAARRRRVVLRLPRARSAEVLRAVLLARLPIARHRIRADCRHRRRRLCGRLNGRRIWPPSLPSSRAPGRFAMSVIGDCPGGMRAALVGIAFSTGARRARYLPIGHTALDEPSALNPRAALAALKDVLENPSLAKIGHDLKFDLMMLSHEGIALDGLEFDTMLASYVLDATQIEPHDRGDRARASRLQGAHAGRHLRLRPEGDSAAAPARRRAAQLRRRARRSRVAARREAARRGCATTASSRCSATWRCRSSRCWRTSSGTAFGSICRRSRASRPRIDAELASRSAKIFELAGESVQHQLAEAAVGDPLRQAAARHRQAHRQDEGGVDRRGRARRSRADARAAEADSRVARAEEAEGHLHRRAAAARARANGARAHVVQPGGGRDRPAEQQRPEPAEHPDPHRSRARDPARVHRRSRVRADLGRLLADRAARARAHGRGRGADRGVPARRGHPRPHRAEGVRPEQRPRQARAPAPGEDHQLRAALRKDGLHAGARHRRHAGRRAGVHRRVLRRLPARPHLHRRDHRAALGRRDSSRRCSDAGAWCPS